MDKLGKLPKYVLLDIRPVDAAIQRSPSVDEAMEFFKCLPVCLHSFIVFTTFLSERFPWALSYVFIATDMSLAPDFLRTLLSLSDLMMTFSKSDSCMYWT